MILPKSSIKDVLKDANFWMVLVAHGLFVLRLQTFVAWLSGGWPEWVVQDPTDPNNSVQQNEFNQRINTLNSVLAVTLIVLNAIPGRHRKFKYLQTFPA